MRGKVEVFYVEAKNARLLDHTLSNKRYQAKYHDSVDKIFQSDTKRDMDAFGFLDR